MSTYNFNKGAQWLKCDLHIHTPISLCSEYGGQTEEIWKKFFNKLEELPEEIKVLGINDYIFLDGYKEVLKYKNNGGLKKIELLLPVIELRIRDFVGSTELNKINYHIIFANDNLLKVEQIAAQFLSGLVGKAILSDDYISKYSWGGVITPETLAEFGKHVYENTPVEKRTSTKYLEIGFSNISFELNKILALLGEGAEPNTYLEGKYLKAIGKVEWESFRWEGSPSDKKSIINNVDFVFSASETIESAIKGKESLKNQGVNCRLLHCSDAHMFAVDESNTKPKELGHCFSWIKCDPTFDGLKQVLIEPEERIFIGKTPPILERVLNNRTKYIKSIGIDAVPGYDGKYGKWFKDNNIELNNEFVAIIGNKGSGKSAIADIISLCGFYKNHDDFSFLHHTKFRSGKLAKNFKAVLTWESDIESPKLLNDDSHNGELEQVKYLPQGYFERLTNEITTTEAFQNEIQNVVFTHLDNEEKLGFESFADLIEYHKANVEREIQANTEIISTINSQLIKLEQKLNPVYKNEVANKLKQKEDELQALIEPPEIKNPSEDSVVSEQNKIILEEIDKLKSEIQKIEEEASNKQEEKNVLLLDLRDLKELKQEIEFKVSEIKTFKDERKELVGKHSLDFETLLTINSNLDSLSLLINTKVQKLAELKEILGEEISTKADFKSLKERLKEFKNKLNIEQAKLDSTQHLYQIYLNDKKSWEEKRNKIIGNQNYPDTISFYKKELDYLENSLANEIADLRNSRLKISENIFDKKQQVIEVYKNVKRKLDLIIEENAALLDEYKININAKLSLSGNFSETFFRNINQNQSGTFYTIEGGAVQYNKLIKEVDFDNKESVKGFLNNVVDAVFNDKRENYDKQRFLEGQIKNPLDLYNSLFSLSFLDYNYELMQGSKKLQQLSPGERGALLLIFYLLLDKNDIPLIIDQPEDNLDNHSVANILVPFIRKAKSKRQIILVTHNPNLAIVSDAEQVIYVNIDKENDYEFEYKSGSIENREINDLIVKVLEGAMPAFNKRKLKYYEEIAK